MQVHTSVSQTSLAKHFHSPEQPSASSTSGAGGPKESSYCNSFWGMNDEGYDVLTTRLRGSGRTVEEVRVFWKERIAIEEDYARKLSKLAKQTVGKDEIGSLKAALDSLKEETEQQAQGHMMLTAEMKRSLEIPVIDFSHRMVGLKKNSQAALEKVYKLKSTQEGYVAKARDKYLQDCRSVNAYTANMSFSQGRELDRVTSKLERAQGNVGANERDFGNFVKTLAETTKRWEADWKLFCDQAQDLEEERIEFLKDVVWSYANAVSSVCVTDDEACERLRVALEAVDPQLETETFLRNYATGPFIPDPSRYIDYSAGELDPTERTYRLASFTRQSARPIAPVEGDRTESPLPPPPVEADEEADRGVDESNLPDSWAAPVAPLATRQQQQQQQQQPSYHQQQHHQQQEAVRQPSAPSARAPSPNPQVVAQKSFAASQPDPSYPNEIPKPSAPSQPPTGALQNLSIGASNNNDDSSSSSNHYGNQYGAPAAAPLIPAQLQSPIQNQPPAREESLVNLDEDPIAKALADLQAKRMSRAGSYRSRHSAVASPISAQHQTLASASTDGHSSSTTTTTTAHRQGSTGSSYAPSHQTHRQTPSLIPPQPGSTSAALAQSQAEFEARANRRQSRDYSQAASSIVGAHPSSRPSSPNDMASQGRAPSPALMQAPSTTSSSTMPVEEVLSRYSQSFPGEGAQQPRSRSRAGSVSSQKSRTSTMSRPVFGAGDGSVRSPSPAREGFAGIGAPAVTLSSLDPRAPSPAFSQNQTGWQQQSYHQQQPAYGQGPPRQPSPAPSRQSYQQPTYHQQGAVSARQPSPAPSQLYSQQQQQQQQQPPARQPSPAPSHLSMAPPRQPSPAPSRTSVQHQQQQQPPYSQPTRTSTINSTSSIPPPVSTQPPVVAHPPTNNAYGYPTYGGYPTTTTGSTPAAAAAAAAAPQQMYGAPPFQGYYPAANQPYGAPQPQMYGSAVGQPSQPQMQLQPQQGQNGGYPVGQSTYGSVGSSTQAGYNSSGQPSYQHQQQQQQQQQPSSSLLQQQQQQQQQRAPSPAINNGNPSPVGGSFEQMTDEGKPVILYVKALYDYQATIDEEFDFQTGDIIAVTDMPDDGWWSGELLDETRRRPGRNVFPSNFVAMF